MGPSHDVAALARELFECMRNVHMNLMTGDANEARTCVAEARTIRDELKLSARKLDNYELGAILLDVLQERIDSLDDLLDHSFARDT